MAEKIFKEEWTFLTEDGVVNVDKMVDEALTSDDWFKYEQEAQRQKEEFFKLNHDWLKENETKFDYAFIFDFKDNDFGGFFYDAIYNEFVLPVQDFIDDYDYYMNSKIKIEYLDAKFNKEFIWNSLKTWFVSQYIIRDYRDQFNEEAITKRFKDALSYVSDFFPEEDKDNRLFVGTNGEVDDFIRDKYTIYQDEQTLHDEYNVDNWWYNGEIIIVRIVDNKLKVIC